MVFPNKAFCVPERNLKENQGACMHEMEVMSCVVI